MFFYRVFDHDVVHDDVIGSVVVDISCLLVKRGPSHISGWFPLYDSIRGKFSYNFIDKCVFILIVYFCRNKGSIESISKLGVC